MKVKIEIECDTDEELLVHLYVIRKQIKKEAKKQGKKHQLGEPMIIEDVHLSDNNCYGIHTIYIEN